MTSIKNTCWRTVSCKVWWLNSWDKISFAFFTDKKIWKLVNVHKICNFPSNGALKYINRTLNIETTFATGKTALQTSWCYIPYFQQFFSPLLLGRYNLAWVMLTDKECLLMGQNGAGPVITLCHSRISVRYSKIFPC